MIRFVINGGTIEIDRSDIEQLIVEVREQAEANAAAYQRALMKVWKVGALTAADRKNPHIGLLTDRLGICEKSCRHLIKTGELAHLPTGESKGYRVTEQMVRDFEEKYRIKPRTTTAAPVIPLPPIPLPAAA